MADNESTIDLIGDIKIFHRSGSPLLTLRRYNDGTYQSLPETAAISLEDMPEICECAGVLCSSVSKKAHERNEMMRRLREKENELKDQTISKGTQIVNNVLNTLGQHTVEQVLKPKQPMKEIDPRGGYNWKEYRS